jgi:NTE family protein
MMYDTPHYKRHVPLKSLIPLLFLALSSSLLTAEEATSPQPMENREKPVIALVLAGGGALGFAHVGVIKALEEEGIQPDIVIGTSIGSIVGGLYSVGYTGEELESIVRYTDWYKIFYDKVDRKYQSFQEKEHQSQYYLTLPLFQELRVSDLGISQAQQVVEMLDNLFQAYPEELDFDQLPRRFRAVATELYTGKEIVFDRGDLKTTIRASMAVPSIFSPVDYQGYTLIDGGWVDNLPAKVAKEMGADIIITVPLVSLKTTPEEISSLTDMAIQADQIRRAKRTEDNLAISDLVISPDLTGFTPADFDKGEEMLARGYEAADSLREEIQRIAQLQGEKPSFPKEEISNPLISINKIVGDSSWDQKKTDEMTAKIKEELPHPLTAENLRELMNNYYDRGGYTHFWYHLAKDNNGGYTLLIDAPEISHSDKVFSAGIDFNLQVSQYTFSSLSVNGAYSQWLGENQNNNLTFDASISSFSDVKLSYDFYPGIGNMRFRSQIYYLQNPRYFYADDSLEALYSLNESGMNFSIKQALYNSLEISLGAFFEYNYVSFRYGSRLYDLEEWFQPGARASLAYDNLDRIITPREGIKAEAYFELSPNETAEPTSQVKVAAQGYASTPHKGWTSLFWTEGHEAISGNLTFSEYPSLGNILPMYGYYPQEIRGENVHMAGLGIRKQIATLPLTLGNEIYLQAAINGAASWNHAIAEAELNEGELYLGGCISMVTQTIAGEGEIGISLNEDFRPSFLVSLKTSAKLLKEM